MRAAAQTRLSDNQFSYFLDIQDNPLLLAFLNELKGSQQSYLDDSEGLVSDIITRPDVSKSSRISIESPSLYDRLLASGTKLDSGRHRTLFHLALHLKNNRGMSLDDAEKKLSDWSRNVASKKPTKERLRDVHSTVHRVFKKDMAFLGSIPSPLTEKEIEVLESVCSSSISVCVAFGSGTRKEDLSKRLKTTTKVALALASMAKTRGGFVETTYRQLKDVAQVSWHALQRAMEMLVEDAIPVFNEDTESDSVMLNMDQRPKRRGGMVLCLHRATYANRQNSKYKLKDEVLEKLGWNHEDSKSKAC